MLYKKKEEKSKIVVKFQFKQIKIKDNCYIIPTSDIFFSTKTIILLPSYF